MDLQLLYIVSYEQTFQGIDNQWRPAVPFFKNRKKYLDFRKEGPD